MPIAPILTTDLTGWKLRSRGKVRDIYEITTLAGPRLLIVTTDRVSAFDVVLPNGIPGKGIVLTQISRFWFDRFRGIVPNHLLSASVEDLPPALHLPQRTALVVLPLSLPLVAALRPSTR